MALEYYEIRQNGNNMEIGKVLTGGSFALWRGRKCFNKSSRRDMILLLTGLFYLTFGVKSKIKLRYHTDLGEIEL